MIPNLDLENRWMYSGSSTSPPCDKSVIWNVLQTPYYVEKKFVDYLKVKQSGFENGEKHHDTYV